MSLVDKYTLLARSPMQISKQHSRLHVQLTIAVLLLSLDLPLDLPNAAALFAISFGHQHTMFEFLEPMLLSCAVSVSPASVFLALLLTLAPPAFVMCSAAAIA